MKVEIKCLIELPIANDARVFGAHVLPNLHAVMRPLSRREPKNAVQRRAKKQTGEEKTTSNSTSEKQTPGKRE